MDVGLMDVGLADGRTLRVHDTGSGALTVLWHHGTPQTGVLLDPLVSAARSRDIRLVSYARPGYGGSSPDPGRTIASAADDVRQILDALGVDRLAMMGSSSGGTHALACAALIPERVTGVATLAAVAEYTDSYDWFAGMAAPGALQAARNGRDARARFAETDEFDPDSFTEADWAALDSDWAALGQDAVRAGQEGPDGQIDDDVALAGPWGFDATQVKAPVLVVQGGADRVIPQSHGEWLLRHLPLSEFWLRPRDGHISVLRAAPLAMDWLLAL